MGIGFVEICIDGLAVVAGIALWRGTSFGRKTSIAIQAIQLPKIVSPAVIFKFSFGFDFWIHASSSIVGFQTAFLGSNQFFLNVHNVHGAPIDIGVSVTALVALVILAKYKPIERVPPEGLPPLPTSD